MKVKKNSIVYAFALALTALSVSLPLFAADEQIVETAVEDSEKSNGSKIKEGAKGIFDGVKGAVKDGTRTAKQKAREITQEAYVGEWYFANGRYATMITFESDWDFKITQTRKNGENVWTGTYDEGPEKRQLTLYLITENGKTAYKKWTITYLAEKKDYIIVSSPDLNNDPNGYDFSNRTLFTYVGK